MKAIVNRRLALLLATTLMVGLAPAMAMPSAWAAAPQAASLPSAQANKSAVLEDLRFSMDSPSGPTSWPYGGGTTALNPYHELLTSYTNQSNLTQQVFDAKKDLVNGVYLESLVKDKYRVANSSSSDSSAYNRVVSADLWNSGKEEYVAQVSMTGAKSGQQYLRLYDARTRAEVAKVSLGSGYDFQSSKNGGKLQPWEAGAFLSVVAGDFDGDKDDELAVYVAGAANQPNRIEVYRYHGGSDLSRMTTINLPDEFKNKNLDNNKKNYLAVDLETADLNGDGRSELVVTAGYHKESSIAGSAANAASSMLIYKVKYDSIYDGFELTRNTKLTFTEDGKNYNLRNASATVGDIDGNGSPEIVVAGDYSLSSKWQLVTHRGDDADGRPRLAIASYNGSGAEITGFKTFQDATVDMVYAYNEDTNDSPVALTAFRANGTNNPESIFVDGRVYSYNTGSGSTSW